MQNASQGGQGLNRGQLVPHVVVGNLPTQKMGWKQREHGWVGPWHGLGHLEMEHRKETRMTVAPTCSKSVTNPHTQISDWKQACFTLKSEQVCCDPLVVFLSQF